MAPVSQDDLTEFAREVCTCAPDNCLESGCTACSSINPEWPCPAAPED